MTTINKSSILQALSTRLSSGVPVSSLMNELQSINPRQGGLLACAIGCAEGNLNPDGSKRFLGVSRDLPTGYPYDGHRDPGDGHWNKGAFSYAPGRFGKSSSMTPAECDEAQLASLRARLPEIETQVRKAGLPPSDPHYRLAVAAAIDLENQAPAAFEGSTGFWNQLPQAVQEMKAGKSPSLALSQARARAFYDERGVLQHYLNGRRSTFSECVQDQKRRMDEIYNCLAQNHGLSPVRGSGATAPSQPTAPAPKPQGTNSYQGAQPKPPVSLGGELPSRGALLFYGARGAQVSAAQQALRDRGYRVGVDGAFGQETEHAVRKFQQDNGLYPDGIIGSMTWEKLAKTAPKPNVQGPDAQPAPGASSGGISGLLEPIVQQDPTSCGLASVAMISNASHARAGTGKASIDDQDLRRENGGGTGYLPNVLNRHLKGSGMVATDEDWSSRAWDTIRKSLDAKHPVMISTNGEFSATGYGHYIVLTKMEGNRVQYADPADGQLKWTTTNILDAQPPHSVDGRWFSRVVPQ